MKIICPTIILMVGLSFIFLFSSCRKPTEPEIVPVNYHNKIMFTSSRSGKEQLYMMDPDGTNIKQLTSGAYWHNNGRWSPDASKIVCNTEEGTTTARMTMAVMNADGSNRKLIGYGSFMSWSPDGNKIVYSFKPRAEVGDRTENIYALDLINSQNDQLTNSVGTVDCNPSISPDGVSIAFSSNRDYLEQPIKSEIYIMNFQGGDIKRLTYLDSTNTLNPYWSHDGSTIIFNSSGKIFSINIQENISRLIYASKGYVLVYPRYSSNGEKISVIARFVDGSEKSLICMMNTDGTNFSKMLEDESVTSCDWSK